MISARYSRVFVLLACLQFVAPLHSVWRWETIKNLYTLENFKWFDKVGFVPMLGLRAGQQWLEGWRDRKTMREAAEVAPRVAEFVRSTLKKQGVGQEQMKEIKIISAVVSNVPILNFFAYKGADGTYINVYEDLITGLLVSRDELRNNPDQEKFTWLPSLYGEQLYERDWVVAETEKLLAAMEVILAHEYAHIKNNDSAFKSKLHLGSVVLLHSFFRLATYSVMPANKRWQAVLRSYLSYGIAALCINAVWYCHARRKEDRADREAVAACPNPYALRATAEIWRALHQNDVNNLSTYRLIPNWFVRLYDAHTWCENLFWLCLKPASAHMPNLDRARYFEDAAEKLEKELAEQRDDGSNRTT